MSESEQELRAILANYGISDPQGAIAQTLEYWRDRAVQAARRQEREKFVTTLELYQGELSANGCDAAAIAMRTAINRIEALRDEEASDG